MHLSADIAALRAALVAAARVAAARRDWSAVASALRAFGAPRRGWLARGITDTQARTVLETAAAAFGDAIRAGDVVGALLLEAALSGAHHAHLIDARAGLLDAIDRAQDARHTLEVVLRFQARGWTERRDEHSARLRAYLLRDAAGAGDAGTVEAVIDLLTVAEGIRWGVPGEAVPGEAAPGLLPPTLPSDLASRAMSTGSLLTADLLRDTIPQTHDEIPGGAH